MIGRTVTARVARPGQGAQEASPVRPAPRTALSQRAGAVLPVLDRQPLNAVDSLLWRANHFCGDRLVRGGWPTVRMLLGSIDGDSWPWTGVSLDTGTCYRWIQVLGTPDRMTVEVGSPEQVWRVGWAGRPCGQRVELPLPCQWWVTWVWENQLLTADQAFAVARAYLRTGHLDGVFWSLEILAERRHRGL